MTQYESRGSAHDGQRARMAEAERRERLTQLVLRRSKLSPEEAALLREMFPQIIAAHYDLVWNLLRKRNLDIHEAENLHQEAFFTLYSQILENGFADNIPGMLHRITEGKIGNHLRVQKRSPLSIGLPSSGSEKPRSQLDVERALHFQEVARRIFPQLSPEHQEVLDTVVLKGLSPADAAALLGLPIGTVKSRLIAAKRAFLALAEPLLPASQRGPL